VLQPRQLRHQGRQQRHGDVLARAAVARRRVAAALRDEQVRTDRPAVGEPRGLEDVRVGPERRIVMVAVDVEQHERAFGDPLPPPFEIPHRDTAQERRERVEAAHLMGEGFRVFGTALPQQLPLLWPPVHGMRGERHEPGHRRCRPDDVEHLDRGGVRVQQLVVVVAVQCHGMQRGAGILRPAPADLLDQGAQPFLLAGTGFPCAPVPRTRGGEAVDHRHQVARRGPAVVLPTGHPRPVAHGAGDQHARLREQFDPRPVCPLRGGGVPLLHGLSGKGVHPRRVLEEGDEQRLAGPVRRAVERVHRSPAEQRVQDGPRQR
jgi:hypothetical protein